MESEVLTGMFKQRANKPGRQPYKRVAGRTAVKQAGKQSGTAIRQISKLRSGELGNEHEDKLTAGKWKQGGIYTEGMIR